MLTQQQRDQNPVGWCGFAVGQARRTVNLDDSCPLERLLLAARERPVTASGRYCSGYSRYQCRWVRCQ